MDIHLQRSPLLTPDGDRMVRRLREHLDPIARFRDASAQEVRKQIAKPAAEEAAAKATRE